MRAALRRVPAGGWREFAAFEGPELANLTNWSSKVVLVGDSSHALSGAFGSGSAFAMEDGWILAQSLQASRNNLPQALARFNELRLPYYSKMYAHLASVAEQRERSLKKLARPSADDRVRNKVIDSGGKSMQWIYGNDIGQVWHESLRLRSWAS